MGIYESFATLYDTFMDEVEYSDWIAHLNAVWQKYGMPESIVDLGCGTGNVTIPLAEQGFRMQGIDFSIEMLSQAKKKADAIEPKLDVFFSCQDITEFELPEQVDCAISLCDSLNYLIEDGQMEQAFGAVRDCLLPNGLFVFDLNTEFKFQHVLGENSFAATTEDAAYFWENSYDEEEKINEYYVNFFLCQKGKETYERIEEVHLERAYDVAQIKKYLDDCGFLLLDVYDGYGFDSPKEDSERLLYVAKLKGEER